VLTASSNTSRAGAEVDLAIVGVIKKEVAPDKLVEAKIKEQLPLIYRRLRDPGIMHEGPAPLRNRIAT
jgi:hypothetical protein